MSPRFEEERDVAPAPQFCGESALPDEGTVLGGHGYTGIVMLFKNVENGYFESVGRGLRSTKNGNCPMGIFMKRAALIILACGLMLPACSPFAPQKRNMVPDELPAKYSLYSDDGPEDSGRWWERFGSPELTALVEQGLGGSFNLREAWARLKQSDAQLTQVRSGLFPTLRAEAEAAHVKQGQKLDRGGSVYTSMDSVSVGLAASWELDLWGRVRAEQTTQQLAVQAGRADLEAAAMSVAGSVAEVWVDLLATRESLRVLETQLRTYNTLLDLQVLRFENSLATALDVLQQKEVVARVAAQVPPLKARERVLLNALAILLGRAPGAAPNVNQKELPDLVPLPRTGLPADLLAMRPDVRAAGLRLKSTDWEVTAAKADRLPTLTLTGRAEYTGENLSRLLDNWLANLVAGLVGPIIDAGRRQAEVDRAMAEVEERLAAYERTVYTAVQEVEDSLINERTQVEHLRLLGEELSAARRAYDEARRRYGNGLDNFIPMLTEMLNVQSLEREIVSARATLVKYRIALYRALGGDWTAQLTPGGLGGGAREEPSDGDHSGDSG